MGFIAKAISYRAALITVCLIVTGCLIGHRAAASDIADFSSRWWFYVGSIDSSIQLCHTDSCLHRLDVAAIKTSTNNQLLYWNNAALSIPWPQKNGSTPIVESSEAFYLSRQFGEIKYFIPIQFKDENRQKQWLDAQFGSSYTELNYDVKIPLNSVHDGDTLVENLHVIPKYGTAYLLLYFISIILCFICILYLTPWVVERLGLTVGSTCVVLLMTGVRLIYSHTRILHTVDHHELFRHTISDHLLSSSLSELFLNMLLFYFITIFFMKTYEIPKQLNVSLQQKRLTTVAGYLFILFGSMSLVYLIERIVLHSPLVFQFDKIYLWEWNTHVFILSILFFIGSLFFLGYLVVKLIAGLGGSFRDRFIMLMISCIISWPMLNFISPEVSQFGFYALMISLMVLMDVFVDSKQKSVSWMVIWLITIASGTTALLYTHHQNAFPKAASDAALRIAHTYEENDKMVVQDALVRDLSWTIFESGQVRNQYGHIAPNNQSIYEIPDIGHYDYIETDDTNLILYRHSEEVVVAVASTKSNVIQFISLFSFLFTSLTLLVVLTFALNLLTKFIPDTWQVNIKRSSSIRRRIQYVVFSMLVLSFATVFAVTSYYVKDHQSSDALTTEQSGALYVQTVTQYLNALSPRQLKFPIEIPAWSHGYSDLFDTKGNSISTHQITVLRPPYDLIGDNPVEKSKLYNGILYQRIRTANLEMIAALQPWVNLNDKDYFINNLLGTLLNLYIFLFVIASSIALAFADTITRPLYQLREQFSSLTIGRSNKHIEWKTNDELGQVIHEYNRMLSKIEESVETLAMTQRELAWREMAKQIAHEIKNPLTPMKLCLQHLEFTQKHQPERVPEMLQGVTHTLLEQIDNLSNIATEFSNFAKMPTPENNKIILNEVASNVHDLFRKRDDMDIYLHIPIDEIYVFGDKHYISRVLINLVKNATQAIPSNRRGRIVIDLYKDKDNAIIKVEDNGTGIPKEIQDRVFQPNFTSKNSGTGLGLAICANIVESFNGKIYFESEINVGTTFYIEIPLMHTIDNYADVHRVLL